MQDFSIQFTNHTPIIKPIDVAVFRSMH